MRTYDDIFRPQNELTFASAWLGGFIALATMRPPFWWGISIHITQANCKCSEDTLDAKQEGPPATTMSSTKSPNSSWELAETLTKDAHQDLRAWLTNLHKHENFEMFVDHLEETDEGITIQIAMLGKVCGTIDSTTSATSIRTHLMKTPGIIIGRSPDAKKFILSKNLKPFFTIA